MVWVWLGFLIFGIIRFESGFRSVDQGDHSQHTFDAFGRRVKLMELTRDPIS